MFMFKHMFKHRFLSIVVLFMYCVYVHCIVLLYIGVVSMYVLCVFCLSFV